MPGMGEGLDLDLFRERHAVAGEIELREDVLLEHPHARLRVDDELEVERHHRAGQDRVSEEPNGALHLAALRVPTARGDEVDLFLHHHVQEERDAVGRIRTITVHRDDDVALGRCVPRLVRVPVALAGFGHDARAGRGRDLGGPVGRVVVDHDDLVDDRRHLRHDGRDAVLLVVARDDHGNALASVHVGASSRMPARCRGNVKRGGTGPRRSPAAVPDEIS